MNALQRVFDTHLPAVLETGNELSGPTIGFAATAGPEPGYWVVSFADKTCRRGLEDDRPEVFVEGDSRVLALMFAGGLDIARTIELGHLRVSGDLTALEALADLA